MATRITFVSLISLVILATADVGARGDPPPLLLSFDVEHASDIAALNKLDLREPATYFVTGQFAAKYPEFVQKLAAHGTIGSHSHAHAHQTEMTAENVRADLMASQKAIKAATGHSPVWFRAPYLEYSDEVLIIARELGFRFDSSESERWPQQKILTEFPISMNSTEKILFSDYDIFKKYGMDADLALDLLKENYRARSATGRPFVFLLHPRIIAEQAATLHQFVRYAKALGGQCLTFEQYHQKILAQRPRYKGVRIDLSRGSPAPEQYAQTLIQAGITDAFLMATDSRGQRYYPHAKTADTPDQMDFVNWQRRLKRAGVRVHAWISVIRNAHRAQQNPAQAMVSGDGKHSAAWISPSHPATHRHLKRTIRELLAGGDLDGIHLDHIAYPDLKHDFSDAALQAFRDDTGITAGSPNRARHLMETYYDDWVAWRRQQIERLVGSAAQTLRLMNRSDVALSAALHPRALSDFKVMETIGQDYRLLAAYLDMVIPFGFARSPSQETPPIESFIRAARFHIGAKPLLIGIPIASRHAASGPQNDDLVETLAASHYGTQGIVFSPAHQIDGTGMTAGQLADVFPHLLRQTEAIWQAAEQHAVSFASMPPEAADHPSSAWMWFKLGGGIVGAAGLSLVVFLIGRRYRKSPTIAIDGRHDREVPQGAVAKDWNQLDQTIARGAITGPLTCEVALLLRRYDPVNVSKYRVAMILDIIDAESCPMNVSAVMGLDVKIPGWQVLCMSYIEEALLLGYIVLKDGCATLSPKGRDEIRRIQSNGYSREYWMFVERRLHENLVVSCPKCHAANVTHWFWPTFTCFKCNREVSLASCVDIVCRSAQVGLDQHKLA